MSSFQHSQQALSSTEKSRRQRELHFGRGLLNFNRIFLELPNNPIFRDHDMGLFYKINQIYINRDHDREKNHVGVSSRKRFSAGIRCWQNGLHSWRLRNGVATTGLLSTRACHCCPCRCHSKISFKPCLRSTSAGRWSLPFKYLRVSNWFQF